MKALAIPVALLSILELVLLANITAMAGWGMKIGFSAAWLGAGSIFGCLYVAAAIGHRYRVWRLPLFLLFLVFSTPPLAMTVLAFMLPRG